MMHPAIVPNSVPNEEKSKDWIKKFSLEVDRLWITE
jgi:hypothetical protein